MTDWCFITCCVSSSDIISQVLSPQVPGVRAHVKIWLIMLILCNRDGNWLEFWGPSSCKFLPNYESHCLDQSGFYYLCNVVNPKSILWSECTDDSCLISAVRLAGVRVSVEEIALSSTAQIRKLEVILEEVDKTLGLQDGSGLKWNVKRESCGQGSGSWRVPIIHEWF